MYLCRNAGNSSGFGCHYDDGDRSGNKNKFDVEEFGACRRKQQASEACPTDFTNKAQPAKKGLSLVLLYISFSALKIIWPSSTSRLHSTVAHCERLRGRYLY